MAMCTFKKKKLEQKIEKKLIEKDLTETKKVLKKYKNLSNWLIIDHYGINHIWEKNIREYVEKIIVIDDLANRKHDCDFLIDQNYYEKMVERYYKLIPNFCKLFLGPKFALLRPEFVNTRKNL